MRYTGNIYLADDLIYIYEYYTYQYEINHYPWALQSVTADFYVDRLYSHFFPYGRSQSSTLGTVWAQTGTFHLKLLINFLFL